MRIDKDTYYLNIAGEVSKRSSCLRSAYGSVIVKNDIIVSTGYNGSCRGAINCCDTGICRRENDKTRSGYDSCPAIHSEENACLSGNKNDLEGAILYISAINLKTNYRKLGIKSLPCWRCYRILINAGISKVYIFNDNEIPQVYDIQELKFVDTISYDAPTKA